MCENHRSIGNVGLRHTGGTALDEEEVFFAGMYAGAAIAAGIIALGEWARRCGKPVCGDCGCTCVRGHAVEDGVPLCFVCYDERGTP